MHPTRKQTIDTIIASIRRDIYNEGVLKHRNYYEYNYSAHMPDEILDEVIRSLRKEDYNVFKNKEGPYFFLRIEW